MATPVFLKAGFSTVIEFEEAPTEIVIGNSSAFQIERLKLSIVIRPRVHTASTNAFVYFKKLQPRLLVLTASDDVTPTYYRKISSFSPAATASGHRTLSSKQKLTAGLRVGRIEFRAPYDFLTVDVTVSANSSRELSPRWELVRLNFRDRALAPAKVWSARRDVMPDSSIRARFIFAKPSVPADLQNVSLLMPIANSQPFKTDLWRK